VVLTLVVFFVCFSGGVLASSRWLPDLADGPAGGIAFLAVCGLLGAALSVIGLEVLSTARSLEGIRGRLDSEVLTQGLVLIMRDGGTLLGLAAIAYLLAPSHAPADGTVQAHEH
jgi:hypothetical protein